MLYKILIAMGLCAPIFLGAQNVMKLTTGATLSCTGDALITLLDMNLDNDGEISFTPGNKVLRFSGTQSNTISGTGAIVLPILEIAKTGSAKITLNRNIDVIGSVNFVSGLIDLNSNVLSLHSTGILNGENENSRIIGNNGGFVHFLQTLNAPSSANPGNLGAIITSSQNLGNTNIRRGHQSQTNGGGGGNSIFRYYDILPANNSALNASLRFHYFDSELNGIAENNLVLWKSPDNTNWAVQGFTFRDASANYVEKTGIADFSRWTLSNPGNALPLVWGSFNLRCVNNSIIISWKTLQEYNTKSFIIQGSTNGNDWQVITTLNAAGQSNNPVDYNFTLTQPSYKFYRILQTDLDSRQTYSPVLRSNCDSQDFFSVYPNPVMQSDVVVAMYATATDREVVLKLYDSKGALIKQKQEALRLGMNQLPFNLGSISAGNYNLVVHWPDGRAKTVKLIKQ